MILRFNDEIYKLNYTLGNNYPSLNADEIVINSKHTLKELLEKIRNKEEIDCEIKVFKEENLYIEDINEKITTKRYFNLNITQLYPYLLNFYGINPFILEDNKTLEELLEISKNSIKFWKERIYLKDIKEASKKEISQCLERFSTFSKVTKENLCTNLYIPNTKAKIQLIKAIEPKDDISYDFILYINKASLPWYSNKFNFEAIIKSYKYEEIRKFLEKSNDIEEVDFLGIDSILPFNEDVANAFNSILKILDKEDKDKFLLYFDKLSENILESYKKDKTLDIDLYKDIIDDLKSNTKISKMHLKHILLKDYDKELFKEFLKK